MDKNENFKEEVLRLAKENKVVYMGINGRPQVSDLDNMIDAQPVVGLLYDLNRLPETVLTRIEDPKWVNDFAVQLVITRLKEKLAQSKARIRELEGGIRKFLEVDMELDDKLNHPVGVEVSPNLYQAVNKAKRELLDIISDKSNQPDTEK